MFYFTYNHKQKNTNITDIREHANVVLEKQKETPCLSSLVMHCLPLSVGVELL